MRIYSVLNTLVLISTFLILFFGVNMLRYFGYQISNEDGNSLQRFLPSVFLMLMVFSIMIIGSRNSIGFLTMYRNEFYFLSFILLLFIYLFKANLSVGVIFPVTNTLILPIILSYYYNISSTKFLKKIWRLIISFFVINSFLAILEKIFKYHLFPITLENDLDGAGFRSTALQNHPLNNAFITCIIISFILLSDLKYKYGLTLLGLVAIICYGSRSSIAVCLVMICLFVFKDVFGVKTNMLGRLRKIILIVFVFIAFVFVYYLMLYTSFGERLISHAYFDDSADVRLKSIEILGLLSGEKLFWGSPYAYVVAVKNTIGVEIIENFWILWVLKFGLVFTITLGALMFKFLYQRVKYLKTLYRFYIVGFFFVVASTNNSLDNTTVVISVFVICSYVFPIAKDFRVGIK